MRPQTVLVAAWSACTLDMVPDSRQYLQDDGSTHHRWGLGYRLGFVSQLLWESLCSLSIQHISFRLQLTN